MASSSNRLLCPQCSRSYDSQAALDQHVRDSHGTASIQQSRTSPAQPQVLPCDKCLRKFPSQISLEQHKKEKHIERQASHPEGQGQSTPVTVPCDECKKTFDTPAALAQHKGQAHGKQAPQVHVRAPDKVMPANDKKLLCGQCNRVYETRSSLDQHVEASHQPPRGQGSQAVAPPPTQIPCRECKRQFSTTAALEQHMQQSHIKIMPANDKKLLCGKCNRAYETQSSLDQHVEASHQPPRGQGSKAVSPPPTQIPCGECKRQFSTSAALEQHKQQSHIKANVQDVKVMPANDKKLLCGQCNRVYETQSSLDQHVEASHQPPRGQGSKAVAPPPTQIPCGECKRQFSTSAALEQHMQQSHIKAVVDEAACTDGFMCGHCARRFPSLVQLQQHQQSAGHQRPVANPRKACIENFIKETKTAITRQDRKESKARVKTTIDDIMKHVRDQSGGKIYIPDVRKAGSSAVGAKIGMADEFDTNIPIRVNVVDILTQGSYTFIYKDKITHCTEGPSANNMNVPRELREVPSINIPHGQALVKVNPQTAPAYLIYKDNLIPHMVLQDFYNKLVVAIRQLGNKDVDLSKERHGPALTLTLKPPGQHNISVDLTVSLPTDLPIDIHGWPRPETSQAFSKEKINEVKKAGTHLVPKGDETWSISFSTAEKVLLRDIDAGNGCRKTVLKFLKRHFQICKSRSKDGLPGISSHIIKTQILWSSEMHPGKDHWHDSNVDQRVIDTMQELEKSLTNGRMPYYFCPTTDVLGNKDRGVLNRLADYIREERRKLQDIPSQKVSP